MSTEELLTKAQEIVLRVNLPDRQTFFQLEKFMIGKEVTGNAQAWQIAREIDIRCETIEAHRRDLEDAEDNLELFDVKIERLDREIREFAKEEARDLDIKEREINIRKLQREKNSLIKAAQQINKKCEYTLEEVGFLVQAFEVVATHLGGDIKPMDDKEAQQEMWNEKLLEEFNLRILLQRPLDPELVKTILCLPDGCSVKHHLSSRLEAIQQQMIENGVKQQKKIAKPQVE